MIYSSTVILRSLRGVFTFSTPSLKSLFGRAISKPPGKHSAFPEQMRLRSKKKTRQHRGQRKFPDS